MPARFSVAQPCATDWAQMTPAAEGRYCAACAKVVVDFTCLSDAEVVNWLSRSGGACGRFRREQLAGFTAPRNWAAWLAAAALTLSSCETPTPAQLTLRTPPTATPADLVVRGQVLDRESGRPLAGAYVTSLADSTVQARTDAAGRFELRLPLALRDAMLYVAASPDTAYDYYIGRRVPLAPEMTVHLRGMEAVLGATFTQLEPGESFVPHRSQPAPTQNINHPVYRTESCREIARVQLPGAVHPTGALIR